MVKRWSNPFKWCRTENNTFRNLLLYRVQLSFMFIIFSILTEINLTWCKVLFVPLFHFQMLDVLCTGMTCGHRSFHTWKLVWNHVLSECEIRVEFVIHTHGFCYSSCRLWCSCDSVMFTAGGVVEKVTSSAASVSCKWLFILSVIQCKHCLFLLLIMKCMPCKPHTYFDFQLPVKNSSLVHQTDLRIHQNMVSV
jgi:hypothetical protein